MITKEQFEQLAGIELIEQDGKLVYYGKLNFSFIKDITDLPESLKHLGNLDLSYRKDITELPDNLKVLGWLNLKNSGVIKLPKGLEVENWFDISGTDIDVLPKDTKFGGSLFVNNMNKPFSFPKVVKSNGYLECSMTTIKQMPEKVYTKDSCNFSHSKFDKLPKVMEVKYSLYMDSTPITELSEGIKEVCGRLDIRHTKVTNLNDNLVVYDILNLGYTQIEELSKGLIVGYNLDLCDTNLKDYSNLHKVCSSFSISENRYEEIKDNLIEHSKRNLWGEVRITFEPNYKGAYLFENENGKYIKVDNIFGKIVKQNGNEYHVKVVGCENITYLITDGEGRWSHGDTLKEAKADLNFKISKRNQDAYKALTLDSKLSFQDAIMCYRVITGACYFGTMDFIEHRLGKNKKEVYTIKEIINLTKDEYGGKTFNDFFSKS